ncbi:MAG: co-chaperone GroES family protein [Planctomycetota bacterium]
MRRGHRELLVVGDRILVKPEEGEVRTKVGLILPVGAVEKEAVQSGRAVAIGPGTPLPPPHDGADEPWREAAAAPARYLPMQVREGDYLVFFRKAAIEISFQDERYLVVPHSAVLVIVRDDAPVPDALPENL